MRITKTDLANYIGINVRNIKKHYQYYLDALELKRPYLTVFDVAKVDDLEPKMVGFIMGLSKEMQAKLDKIGQ